MKKRKGLGWLLGICIVPFCLLEGSMQVCAKSSLIQQEAYTLQNVVQKDGDYQLHDGAEQGNITFLNDAYSHLKVTGYTRCATFASLRGNQPVRGYTNINIGSSEILRLRYAPDRSLLLACDGQEVFGIYPSGEAADGGYLFSSMFGIFSAGDFLQLSPYGISLEYSKDNVYFFPMETDYAVVAIEMGEALLYQETHSANVPPDAAWLRISLSCAYQLRDSYGQLLPNPMEHPATVSSIQCKRPDGIPPPPASSDFDPSSSYLPEESSRDPSSTSSDTSTSSPPDSSEESRNETEDTSSIHFDPEDPPQNDGFPDGSSSSIHLKDFSKSSKGAKDIPSTDHNILNESISFQKPSREPAHYTIASSSKASNILSKDEMQESSPHVESLAVGGTQADKAEEKSEEGEAAQVLRGEPEVSQMQQELPAALPLPKQEGYSGFLALYLSGIVGIIAFLIGRASAHTNHPKK